jgi:ribosome-associated protein
VRVREGAHGFFFFCHNGPVNAPVPEALRAAARRALALPDAAFLAECDEAFFTAGGPGGQHRNKTESGVRLVHRATGAHVTATERRSQARNRTAALARLRAKLAALARKPRPRRATEPTRASRERRLREKRRRGERKSERRERD